MLDDDDIAFFAEALGSPNPVERTLALRQLISRGADAAPACRR